MGYVFVLRDSSEVELVLECKVIEANLGKGATGREGFTLHAPRMVLPRMVLPRI